MLIFPRLLWRAAATAGVRIGLHWMRRIHDAMQSQQASGHICRSGGFVLCARSGYELRPSGPRRSPSARFPSPSRSSCSLTELSRLLNMRGAERPLILQVGSHVLFAESHIKGSEYVRSRLTGCGLAAVARPCPALAAQDLHRDLLWLLPVESLPERGTLLQGAHRYGIHPREGSLSGR